MKKDMTMRTLKTLIAALLLTTTATGANAGAWGKDLKPGYGIYSASADFVCTKESDVAVATRLAVQGFLVEAMNKRAVSCNFFPEAVNGVIVSVNKAGGTIKLRFDDNIYHYASLLGDWRTAPVGK